VQDLPRVFGEAYGDLGAYLGESGVEPSGMPLAAYHNLDMHDMDVKIGFPVPRALPGRGRIQAGTIPGGSWIAAAHIGPYDSLKAVYDTLMQDRKFGVSNWVMLQGSSASSLAYGECDYPSLCLQIGE
jgi:effector-binding domain-containing protein